MTTLAWAGAIRDRGRLLRLLQDYGVYAALALLFLVAVALDPTFLSTANVRIQLFQVSPTLLVALGMALLPAYDAVARVKTRGHWQSDVLVGAALGTGVGLWAAHRDSPLIINWLPGGFKVGFIHRFK